MCPENGNGTIHGHGGVGLGLDLMTLEIFSNLNDSMIHDSIILALTNKFQPFIEACPAKIL